MRIQMDSHEQTAGTRVDVFQGLEMCGFLGFVGLSSADKGGSSFLIHCQPSFGMRGFARRFLPVEWVTKVEAAVIFNFVFQLAELEALKLLGPQKRRGGKHRRSHRSGRRLWR